MRKLALAASLALSVAALASPFAAVAEEEELILPGEAGTLVDTDGDGIVTAAEMDAFAVAVFPAMDANGDGAVDKAEAGVVLSEEQIVAIDTNQDGSISVEELTETVRADFKAADQDGDGVLK